MLDVNKSEWNKSEFKWTIKGISTKELTKYFIEKFNILNGAKYFSAENLQNYLVFILSKKYIKYFSVTTWIDLRESTEVSEENIEKITESDGNFAPLHLLPDISFN